VEKPWPVLAEQHLEQMPIFWIQALALELKSLHSEKVFLIRILKYDIDVNLVGICPEA
jgi:hypothetical protein